ncbi:MAG: 3-oxoacyl-[acyl-carrier-protein] reductase [Holosporales bacterium]|jgi:3-oxoacyl-[acyl-carrier protein] reductase
MFRLDNQTALVTGASGGIGRAMAQAFSEAGASVVLAGTRQAVLEEVAAALPGKHTIITGDMAKPETADRLVEESLKAFGRLDIIVNNAGVTKDGLMMRMKDEDWQTVLDINLTGAFRLCRAALKPMMKARSGRIINISSVVGFMGNAGQSNYVASKAGLIGLTKSLALEVASRNITVNAIAPGFIKTPMTDALNEQQTAAMLARIPLGVYGEPGDIAAAALYLASPGGRYVTGQTVHVNGGLYL